MPHQLTAFSPDGHRVGWETWDGTHREDTTITWENEGWTVVGDVGRERVQYVVRLNALWHVRQFLLFRDLDEPDLWLGTDGAGRWGEVNGAHRPELDGCVDLDLACTPFSATLPIRRLPLAVGDSTTLDIARVDAETLEIRRVHRRYTRMDVRRWRVDAVDEQSTVEFDVDAHGLVTDYPDEWRRVPPTAAGA